MDQKNGQQVSLFPESDGEETEVDHFESDNWLDQGANTRSVFPRIQRNHAEAITDDVLNNSQK